MSALTKVFVALHVVLSMMLVAAMVVFVNKVDDYQKLSNQAKSDLAVATGNVNRLNVEVTAVQGEKNRAIQEATDRIAGIKMLNDQLAQQNRDQAGQVAAAQIEVQRQQGIAQAAQDAVKAAQGAVATAEQALQTARKENDDLQKKYSEAMVSNSDVGNKFEVTFKQNQKLQGDIAALEEDNKRLRDQLASAPRTPTAPRPGGNGGVSGADPAAAAQVAGGQNLRGVVRSKKDIQNVQYATISLGSADNVQKGMQFRVIDRNAGQFLGYLIIDSVDANEATGHLSGPNVAAVKAGNEVLTQWH